MQCTGHVIAFHGSNSSTGCLTGAALEDGAVDISECVVDRPTIVVMGSEGFGLRTNTRRACTQLVGIGSGVTAPVGVLADTEPLVDSLNVSVATGILLHDLMRKRK